MPNDRSYHVLIQATTDRACSLTSAVPWACPATTKAKRIDRVYGVSVDVRIGLFGLVDERVDADELSRLRVVVAAD
jgi:hypothetical protein